jgi:hypothetical protein
MQPPARHARGRFTAGFVSLHQPREAPRDRDAPMVHHGIEAGRRRHRPRLRGEIAMTEAPKARRTLLVAGAGLAMATAGLVSPVRAQGLAPTPTMRGGANNYRPGAPIVERIGGGGFWLTGTVRRAGDGAPLPGVRIQVWAHTTEGHERDLHSHGATLTDANGVFRMEMPQIVPAFGQAHGHVAYDAAYDDNGFETVFLRPVMRSARDTRLSADFVLRQA